MPRSFLIKKEDSGESGASQQDDQLELCQENGQIRSPGVAVLSSNPGSPCDLTSGVTLNSTTDHDEEDEEEIDVVTEDDRRMNRTLEEEHSTGRTCL